MAFPENIMAKLRERRGLEPDDTSQDNRIVLYTPRRALEEVAAWELGYSSWAGTFLRWARECGMVIDERPDRVGGGNEIQS